MTTTGEYIAQGLRDGAHFLGEAIAKSLERIAHEIERVGDNMQVGIVDDELEGEHAPPNSTEPATVDNSGPDSDPQGLTVAELDALPEWSVVDATGGERWFVKCPDGWSAVGENYFIRLPEGLAFGLIAEALIADEGPIRLECRAPGPDELVIKRPQGWGPGRARDGAKQWSDYPLSGILHAVADALEAEQ